MNSVRRLILPAALLAGLSGLPFSSLGGGPQVDVALVLAIDVSYSVDRHEHLLQMRGFADALQSEAVMTAIRAGETQKIAVTVFQWSGNENQGVILPWTIIEDTASANAVAAILAQAPRSVEQGGTGISGAMIFGASLFAQAPAAIRNVIDVSTDGRNNMGRPAPVVRDFVTAQGITVNGLAISNEWPDLARYLERQVIGGPAAFAEEAKTYDDFGAAIQRKIIKEIRGPGLT